MAVGVISQRVRRYYYIHLECTDTQYNMMIHHDHNTGKTQLHNSKTLLPHFFQSYFISLSLYNNDYHIKRKVGSAIRWLFPQVLNEVGHYFSNFTLLFYFSFNSNHVIYAFKTAQEIQKMGCWINTYHRQNTGARTQSKIWHYLLNIVLIV